MRQLLTTVFRFLLRHALQFVLFVVILLAGRYLLAEWRAFQSTSASLGILREAASAGDRHGATLAQATGDRLADLQYASQAAVDSRLLAVQEQWRRLTAEPSPSLFTLPLPDAVQLAARAQQEATRRVEIELLAQEARYLGALQAALRGDDARLALARRHQEHVRAYAALQANLEQQRRLELAHPLAARLPGNVAHEQLAALETQEARLRQANLAAYQQYLLQNTRTVHADRPAPFAIDNPALAGALAPLRQAIAAGETQLARNWIARWRAPVLDVIPVAALLVLSAILTPLAIKAFFYFVLAPLASRLKPLSIAREVRLDGVDSALPLAGQSRISGVSQALLLAPGDTMLIHPAYLQSSPIGTRKHTQWLLDWSYPFTSLAAGMAALTRITSSEPASVTLSASDDPLMEVAVLYLPEGAALVFQPRGLVGLIFHGSDRPAISSHWRLASQHARLTLQLRFIVFRGPLTLIVRGTRGVRMEAASQGRSISQAATLGFSTGVLYWTTRSETFIPYLRGQQALLNDRFDGDGVYLYEETPRHGKQPGKVGSWFEGLTDAVLKVFGV